MGPILIKIDSSKMSSIIQNDTSKDISHFRGKQHGIQNVIEGITQDVPLLQWIIITQGQEEKAATVCVSLIPFSGQSYYFKSSIPFMDDSSF